MIDTLLLLQLVSTLFMCGLIWFVQVVHYPLMANVGEDRFAEYERRHQSLTSIVVAVPMLTEAAVAGWLFWLQPKEIPWALNAGGLALVFAIWLSTIFWQMPAHRALDTGFDSGVHRKLVTTNWVRTFAWSLRGVLVCWIGF